MLQLIPIDQIISRAAAIRLPFKALAKQAGVEISTVHRARDKGGCRTQTLEALQRVVLAEEVRLLKHLAALHPEELVEGRS